MSSHKTTQDKDAYLEHLREKLKQKKQAEIHLNSDREVSNENTIEKRQKINSNQNEELRWGDPSLKLKDKSFEFINRFGIKPGALWDGVDRSNGFESKYFQAKAKQNLLSEKSYKLRTEDL